jgi:NNP family nitrate/nitrite transporter-like MFS transporter
MILGVIVARPELGNSAQAAPPRYGFSADIAATASGEGVAMTDRTSGGAAARNLALATVAFTLCFAAWSLISPFAKTFKADLGLSYTEALLLTAVPVVLGSLLRIPMGTLTDRYGGRPMFSALLAFSALPAVLFGYAHGYWALIGVGFLLGVAGSSFAVGVPFVANWYPKERQGFAVGVYGVGNVGTAVTFFSAPAIVDHWGRPALGWITAAILLAGAALFAATARDAPARGAPAHYREVLRSGWRLYRLAFFYFITFGGFVAMFLLLPTVLQDWFDFSKGEASARAAGFVIAATIARPVGGWLSDRYGAYPVLVLVFAGIAVCAAVLASLAPTPRIVPITIACLALGSFLGAGSGAVFKLVPHEFPRDAGAAAGVVGAAGGLGGFFPPVFVGLVKDAEGTYTYGFVGLLVFTVLSLAGAVWLLRSAPELELRGVPHGGVQA